MNNLILLKWKTGNKDNGGTKPTCNHSKRGGEKEGVKEKLTSIKRIQVMNIVIESSVISLGKAEHIRSDTSCLRHTAKGRVY